MSVTKRSKNSRQRGYTTHGWGAMKKHRGAGNRGGRGRSGSGKRGDQKKPRYWQNKKYFGKSGFISKSRIPRSNPINIKTLEDNMETYLKKGLIRQEGDVLVIDLADLGYNKLLSTGKATKKMKITTSYAVPRAVEKVTQAGGNVNVLNAKAETAESPDETPAEEAEASE